MVRLAALEALGFYREPFVGAEDHELYLRLARGGYKLANLEQTFAVRVMMPNSITSRRQWVLRRRLRVLAHHFEPRSLHAYLGLASNLGFLLLPRTGVLRMRQLGDRIGRWRAAPRL